MLKNEIKKKYYKYSEKPLRSFLRQIINNNLKSAKYRLIKLKKKLCKKKKLSYP